MRIKKPLALALASLFLFAPGALAARREATEQKETPRVHLASSAANIKATMTEIEAEEAARNAKPPAYTTEDFKNKKELEFTIEDFGGKLLFSDCPEYVKEPGILYEDTITGRARVFYYHLNDSHKRRKVAVLLSNVSKKGTLVNVKRAVISERISHDSYYYLVGRGVQAVWYSPASERNDIIYVGEANPRLLDEKMDNIVLLPQELIEGVYEFETSEPVKVTVLMYPEKESPTEFLKKAKLLSKENHHPLRGTYDGMNRRIRLKKKYNPRKDGIAYIDIGDGEKDFFREGVDATDGKKSVNYGNYGIDYTIHIEAVGSGKTHYYLTPRGGVFGGVIRAHFGERGRLSKKFFTPEDGWNFGVEAETDFIDLGSYDNDKVLWFDFSPPGAANLPVRLIMVPEEY